MPSNQQLEVPRERGRANSVGGILDAYTEDLETPPDLRSGSRFNLGRRFFSRSGRSESDEFAVAGPMDTSSDVLQRRDRDEAALLPAPVFQGVNTYAGPSILHRPFEVADFTAIEPHEHPLQPVPPVLFVEHTSSSPILGKRMSSSTFTQGLSPKEMPQQNSGLRSRGSSVDRRDIPGSFLSQFKDAASSMKPKLASMWSGGANTDQNEAQTPEAGTTIDESNTREGFSIMHPSTWLSSAEEEAKREGMRHMHSDQMVDYLDVLDPAVTVFNALQDYGNSVMIPHIPWIYNRRPTLHIDRVVSSNYAPEVSPTETSPLGFPGQNPYATLGAEEQSNDWNSDNLHRTQRESSIHSSNADMQDGLRHAEIVNKYRRASLLGDISITDSTMDRMMGEPLHHQQTLDSTGFSTDKPLIESEAQMEEDLEDFMDPHTDKWWDMDEEERKELEHHIRYLLTNKSKTKRALKGFLNFIRTPMGFILTTYGLLITGWGMLIFLLVLRWVVLGDEAHQRYWIEICDQVLCALFAAVGLGFAPFRAVDTYRMAYIAHYHFVTYKRRKLLNLPKLENENELPRYSDSRIQKLLHGSPDADEAPEGDNRKELRDPSKYLQAIGVKHAQGGYAPEVYGVENLFGPIPGQPGAVRTAPEALQKQRLQRAPSIKSMVSKDTGEVSMLSPTEQAMLQHQQRMFHASHTFYRYCETSTHWPFPLRIMMAIVILLDSHSILQATLGGVTWGIPYHHRPTALTATIISCSLSCNAIAGILIWQGGKRTRKTEVVKRRVKLALEELAIERMERKRRKAAELKALQHQYSKYIVRA
ncbi:hypothetical protein MVES1_000525 [Malassezia vespertilionis]|uniref:uncharacterized protein n=1 Tax=Malassezia vespertilionis TaxID=2020962 RepID=UPI0024B1577C|nr:uncharacterized protein MVES1_000525 [Malassezia vespertilionis]WFD05197.1 hypothetical protein MVES1_000525 [Malassezia vespertilionis]